MMQRNWISTLHLGATAEHTLHGDAAAIRAFAVGFPLCCGFVRGRIGSALAAHVNFVFACLSTTVTNEANHVTQPYPLPRYQGRTMPLFVYREKTTQFLSASLCKKAK